MPAGKKRKSGAGLFNPPFFYRLVLFTGLAFVIALADRAPIDLESVTSEVHITEGFLYYWEGVVFQSFPGPFVYRILIPYSLWGLNILTSIDLVTLDLILKVILLIGVQLVLYRYFREFSSKLESFLGVMIFNALMGYLLSFIKGPSIIETSDILNVLIIAAGLWAIYKSNYPLLIAILFAGLLNRETPLVLLPILFMHDWLRKKIWSPAVLISIFSLLIFAIPRLLINPGPGSPWFNYDELISNLPFLFASSAREAIVANARLVILLAPFLILGLFRFKEHPKYLQIAASAVPVLIVGHYFVGRIIETRLWMPLFPFLIPLVVRNLSLLSKQD